jgi:ApbE superfamily uncharacterized protein (UPF0280 family)
MATMRNNYAKSSHVERDYRHIAAPDLLRLRICVGESDLMVLAARDIRAGLLKWLKYYRRQLKQYIETHPAFATALSPTPPDSEAPELVQWMIAAASKAGVGPMAAVAGAIAGILAQTIGPAAGPDLIIENGGDIYLRSRKERTISVYAGDSPFSRKIGLRLPAQPEGIAVCTSAGTVGPSLSFGKADAAVIIAPDAALADATATATANRVQTAADLETALVSARKITGITGILIIKDDKIAAWGNVELVPLKIDK